MKEKHDLQIEKQLKTDKWLIGVALVIATVVQVLVGADEGAFVILVSVVISFILMLYAQFRYNKGLF